MNRKIEALQEAAEQKKGKHLNEWRRLSNKC